MMKVYGIAPSELMSSAKALAVFPSFSGRTVGGVIPVDCDVKLVELSSSAIASSACWAWKPAHRGYLVLVRETPLSVLKNHLRKIRYFQDELGHDRVWPWFDPRYLKLAMNKLEDTDLDWIFGPVHAFGFLSDAVSESASSVELYQLHDGRLHIKQVSE